MTTFSPDVCHTTIKNELLPALNRIDLLSQKSDLRSILLDEEF